MTTAWRTFKRFLNAEEVPRWFGLSLVLIYLAGLGAVAYLGIAQSRRDAAGAYLRVSEYAVRQLAERLSTLGAAEPWDPRLSAAHRRALRGLAVSFPGSLARIVDSERRVIASIDAREVGTVVPDPFAAGGRVHEGERTPFTLFEQGGHDRWLQAPIAPGRTQAVGPGGDEDTTPRATPATGNGWSAGGKPKALTVEVRLGRGVYGSSGLARHGGTLSVILVVLGALFVIYRRLREQLGGLSRIGERLQSHRDHIEQDLASLQIVESQDSVTSAWNELVSLSRNLASEVERGEANQELSLALQRCGGGALSEALNAIPDGIMYIANEVHFEYLNSTAGRLMGWNPEEAKQITLPEAQADGVGGEILDMLRDSRQVDGSFEARTEDLEAGGGPGGDNSSYRVWLIPLQRPRNSDGCIVVIRDVSQQVRSERAREEFVTQVTHELRTPLTNIRAYAETLSSGMFEDPQVITECYNVITKETRRLSRLIEDILSVSQLEVGSIELNKDSVDLKTLLNEGVRDIRGLADEKNIDVQLTLPSKTEPISADRDKLAVVINNLLGNAIKYTPSGGDIVVGGQITPDAVVVTVKDNGIGIDPADHARVFEKFQRADDPAVKSEPGSGIGLFTAREIVRCHGGDIELISGKGQGSTFIVRLPHRQSRATATAARQKG